MAEKKQMVLNRLPAPTWNWLRVNRTVLDWENENEIDLGAVVRSVQGKENEPLRLEIRSEGEYSRKDVDVTAEPDSAVTIIETFGAEQNLLVRTHLTARRNATIRLVQIQNTQEGSRLVSTVEGECEEGGRIELYQVLAGKGDVYGDSKIELNGDGASFEAETGYLARKQQKVDINLVVNHRGKRTECEINAAGALMDAASKIFRGTIDIKRGASDSVGNEKETVLMLGDDVTNRTVPLILCAEENVVGNHGASIGQLDDETLFYFESRGIGRDVAEKLLARASIERVARLIGDEEAEGAVMNLLDEELGR